jgi:hemerythrin-like domain-containing protein
MLRGQRAEQSAPDALSLIHSDHQEVAQLFEVALGDGPAAQKRQAVTQIVDALTLHAKMEEAIFYPALRAAGKAQEKDSVLEAAEEHGIVKDLIAKIKRVQGRDETLKAKLTVLKESVEHHVQEEESTIFDEARRVLGDRLGELGEEMQRFKENGGKRTRASTNGRSAAGRRTGNGRRSAASAAPANGSKNGKSGAQKSTATRGRKKSRSR